MKRNKQKLLELYKGNTLPRWRLMHKETGEVVECNGVTVDYAAHFVGWRLEDCYWVALGSGSILLEPKRLGWSKDI